MVMSAYMLVVVVCGERPVKDTNSVLLRGDNETAVQWVRRYRGGKEPRPGPVMCLLGAIELAGGWYFDSLQGLGALNGVADGSSWWSAWELRQKPFRPPSLRRLAQVEHGGRRSGAMYVSLGPDVVGRAVARTSECTFEGYFRRLELFRVSVGLAVFLLVEEGVDSHVFSLLAYAAYSWRKQSLKAGTIAGHLAVAAFFHRHERGLGLFVRHPWIVEALKGVARSHAEAETVSRMLRPIA